VKGENSMRPDSYRKISASLVSPNNFRVGDIGCGPFSDEQWEIIDFVPAPPGNRGSEYASVVIRPLEQDERVKPELVTARFSA
jgi:hypothetical protein